jgi:hypothetical protein
MSTKIRIGADELILWLRKNKIAVNVSNEGTKGLGKRIHDLIVSERVGGKKVDDNFGAHWQVLMDAKNVEKFNLPKTSAQYEIDTDKIGGLYYEMSRW